MPHSKIYSKAFPGECIEDMEDYIKPSMKHNPDMAIINCGTNNLRSKLSSQEIATNIIKLRTSMKSADNEVVISSLIKRGDGFNNKTFQVNKYLYEMVGEHELGFLDNSNISLEHLQGNGHWGAIHLNENGNDIIKQNFIGIINL